MENPLLSCSANTTNKLFRSRTTSYDPTTLLQIDRVLSQLTLMASPHSQSSKSDAIPPLYKSPSPQSLRCLEGYPLISLHAHYGNQFRRFFRRRRRRSSATFWSAEAGGSNLLPAPDARGIGLPSLLQVVPLPVQQSCYQAAARRCLRRRLA